MIFGLYDSICEVKTNISIKEVKKKKKKRRQKSLCKRFYKPDGTNTVLSHAFPSIIISQRCLRIWDKAQHILIDRKAAPSWKTNRISSFT